MPGCRTPLLGLRRGGLRRRRPRGESAAGGGRYGTCGCRRCRLGGALLDEELLPGVDIGRGQVVQLADLVDLDAVFNGDAPQALPVLDLMDHVAVRAGSGAHHRHDVLRNRQRCRRLRGIPVDGHAIQRKGGERGVGIGLHLGVAGAQGGFKHIEIHRLPRLVNGGGNAGANVGAVYRKHRVRVRLIPAPLLHCVLHRHAGAGRPVFRAVAIEGDIAGQGIAQAHQPLTEGEVARAPVPGVTCGNPIRACLRNLHQRRVNAQGAQAVGGA